MIFPALIPPFMVWIFHGELLNNQMVVIETTNKGVNEQGLLLVKTHFLQGKCFFLTRHIPLFGGYILISAGETQFFAD